ncbi:MAG: hypothetical protein ACU83N_00320 [Gammaproteobacteria bacterium]
MKKSNKLWVYVLTGTLGLGLLATGCSEKMAQHDRQKTLAEAVEQAQTKGDHEAVAARYDAEAQALMEKARKHEKLASVYEQTDNPKMTMGGDAARHCRAIAQKLREAAADNTALANMHRQMAE